MNKNKIIFSVLVLLALGVTVVRARITSDSGDIVAQDTQAVDNGMVHMALNSVTAPTSTVLVDLSDNLYFPHIPSSGSVEVSKIRTCFSVSDPDGHATTSAKFGVIASSTPNLPAKQDIKYFAEMNFSTLNGWDQCQTLDIAPSLVKLSLAGSNGTTTSFLSNDEELLSSKFASTVPLMSPRSASSTSSVTKPSVGDLVMRIAKQSGVATITTEVWYHAK